MVEFERKTESKDTRESESSKVSSEVQDLQRKRDATTDKSLKDSQKTVTEQLDGNNPFEIVDGKESRKIKGLALDENGQVKQFEDQMGEVYRKDENGKWSRFGLLSPNGEEKLEDVKMDGDNLNITYRIPKDDANPDGEADLVTKQVRPDGSEVTVYPNAKTVTTHENGLRTVKVLNESGDENKPMQIVKFAVIPGHENEPPQPIFFQDPEGNVYERCGDAPWTKTDKNGNITNFDGKVQADSDGKVTLLPNAKGEKSLGFLPNGTRIETLKTESTTERILTLSDKTTIENKIDERSGKATMTTTRPDGTVTKVDFDKGGSATSYSTTKDGVTSSYKRETLWYGDGGTLYTKRWLDTNGNVIEPDAATTKLAFNKTEVDLLQDNNPDNFRPRGNNPIEYRPLIEEVPENYKDILESRLKTCREQPFEYKTNEWFKDMVKDNGDWDDKKHGRQYQAWGNVVWGMEANELGYEFEIANAAVGLYKIGEGKTRPEWVFSKTLGQNPMDYEYSKRGFELREQQRQTDNLPENPNITKRNQRREAVSEGLKMQRPFMAVA